MFQKVNKEKEIKQNTLKKQKKQSENIQPISGKCKRNTRKQNKKNSQNKKSFLLMFQHQDSNSLKE